MGSNESLSKMIGVLQIGAYGFVRISYIIIYNLFHDMEYVHIVNKRYRNTFNVLNAVDSYITKTTNRQIKSIDVKKGQRVSPRDNVVYIIVKLQ